MNTFDFLFSSLHNLLLHKVRSFLTSLGVIFGVGSVIAMLAISEGAKRKSLAQIEALGIDNIIIYGQEPPLTGNLATDKSRVSVMKKYGLTEQDLNNIKKMDNIAGITTVRNARKKVMKGTIRLDVMLVAVSISFLKATKSEIEDGRWLTPIDNKQKSFVCVIGKKVKRKLFPLGVTNVVSRKIRIEGILFKIVGVLSNKLNKKLPELNTPENMIYIPEATSRALYGLNAFQRESRANLKITHIEYDLFIVKVNDISYIDNTAKRIRNYFSKIHTDKHDWGIIVPYELFVRRKQTQRIFAIVMGSIAGISLLVGGIGIMNIMLANVYERRKEIGIRRALGAKKEDILLQFLLETIFLTFTGGILGIGAGVGIAFLVAKYAAWPTVFSLWSIGIALGIAVLTGLIFGTYPAWKAANQNPITVLRSE